MFIHAIVRIMHTDKIYENYQIYETPCIIFPYVNFFMFFRAVTSGLMVRNWYFWPSTIRTSVRHHKTCPCATFAPTEVSADMTFGPQTKNWFIKNTSDFVLWYKNCQNQIILIDLSNLTISGIKKKKLDPEFVEKT